MPTVEIASIPFANRKVLYVPYLMDVIESIPLVRPLQRNQCNTRENIAKLYLYPDFIVSLYTNHSISRKHSLHNIK